MAMMLAFPKAFLFKPPFD
jgi:hypothetical protein